MDIRAYLQALRTALAGCDPALVQDALAETEATYRSQRDRLAWSEPLLGPAEASRRVLEALGDPGERAARFRERDQVVAQALGPIPAAPVSSAQAAQAEPDPAPRPWPSFFGIFLDGRAYTTLAYLLLGLITGTFYFAWTLTGISLSIGLLILIIGIPIAAFFLGSIRALGLGEGRLVEALLDVRMPRRPPLLPEGRTWMERLGGLFKDGYTWKCLIYFMIHFPLSLFTFCLTFTAVSVSLCLVAAPILAWVLHVPFMVWGGTEIQAPLWAVLLLPLSGFLGLLGTLHLGMAFGRLHGGLARALLVDR
ncbi:MAG TPA: sensor domain-containing protein [Holophaga sp.]|nr:sensor domain-containing protein [Holophaga sp.]